MHLAGEVYPDKPPLVFWLAGLCGRLTGWSELALRLPSLLATLGTAWLTSRIARRLWGELEASWVPLFQLSTIFLVHVGGRLQLDPMLGFFCLASLDVLTNPTLGEGPRSFAGGLCAGFAALVKGPVGWLHVLLPVLGWRWVLGGKEVAHGHLRPRSWLAFGFAALLPAGLWASAAALADPSLARELFWGQYAGRVVEGRQHAEPLWFYFVMLAPLLLPWTFLGAAELTRAFGEWRRARRGAESDGRLVGAALWFLVVLAVFSLIPVKRNLYLLPIVPAFSLILARAMARAQRCEELRPWIVRWSAGTMAVVGVCGAVALLFRGLARGWLDADALEVVDRIGWRIPAFGLLLLVSALAALAARSPRAFALRLGLGFSLAASVYTILWVPEINGTKSARGMAEYLAARAEHPTELPCIGFQPEGYRFYGHVPAKRVEGVADLERALEREGPNFLALVDRKGWDRMSADEQRSFRVLEERPVGAKRALVLGRAGS